MLQVGGSRIRLGRLGEAAREGGAFGARGSRHVLAACVPHAAAAAARLPGRLLGAHLLTWPLVSLHLFIYLSISMSIANLSSSHLRCVTLMEYK